MADKEGAESAALFLIRFLTTMPTKYIRRYAVDPAKQPYEAYPFFCPAFLDRHSPEGDGWFLPKNEVAIL